MRTKAILKAQSRERRVKEKLQAFMVVEVMGFLVVLSAFVNGWF